MNSNPKILVFRMREMIYTLLLAVFAVLLLVCLFLMFSGRTTTETKEPAAPSQDIQNAGQQTDASHLQSTGAQNDSSNLQSAGQQSNAGQTDENRQTQNDDLQQSASSLQAASSSIAPENTFTPGIYTVPLYLNDASLEVEVAVDADHINSIRLVNLSESVEAMYPLMSPSLDHIATQILQKQSLSEITSPQENRYTSQMLLNAISDALSLAQP